MKEKNLYYLVEIVPNPIGEDSLYLVAAFSSRERAEGAAKIYQGICKEAPYAKFDVLDFEELTDLVADWGEKTS